MEPHRCVNNFVDAISSPGCSRRSLDYSFSGANEDCRRLALADQEEIRGARKVVDRYVCFPLGFVVGRSLVERTHGRLVVVEVKSYPQF